IRVNKAVFPKKIYIDTENGGELYEAKLTQMCRLEGNDLKTTFQRHQIQILNPKTDFPENMKTAKVMQYFGKLPEEGAVTLSNLQVREMIKERKTAKNRELGISV
ncbi:MAG TPA: hypothetical protein VIY47_09535, partial [Ignavibacteriaceae bacterium]